MYYHEYVKSANRHLSSCKILLQDIDDKKKQSSEKAHWINEVYYLSGYIIECLLSYVLFYKYSDDVQKSQYYKDPFLTHSLESKVYHITNSAQKQLIGVPIINAPSTKKYLNRLFSSWSVDFRYEPNRTVNLTELKEYISTIEEIKRTILIQYPLLK